MVTHSSILAWRIPMDRGAWRATVLGVTESDTAEQTSIALRSIGATGAARQEQPGHLGEVVEPSCPALNHHRLSCGNHTSRLV